jgi:hypothetical protein
MVEKLFGVAAAVVVAGAEKQNGVGSGHQVMLSRTKCRLPKARDSQKTTTAMMTSCQCFARRVKMIS